MIWGTENVINKHRNLLINQSITLTEVFPCFSSVVRQMPGLNSQSRGTDRISSELLSFVLCLSLCCAVVFMLFCCYYVVVIVLLCYYLCCPMYWLCVLYHCHRVLIQLQLTNISIYCFPDSVSHSFISYLFTCQEVRELSVLFSFFL